MQYWLAVTVAFPVAMLLSAMLHFLMFYAFWHCICLAAAELWGYPDRDFYGEIWVHGAPALVCSVKQ